MHHLQRVTKGGTLTVLDEIREGARRTISKHLEAKDVNQYQVNTIEDDQIDDE